MADPNPVLATRRTRKFLVVVDKTPECRVALRFATRRAQHTGGRVTLMSPSDGVLAKSLIRISKDEVLAAKTVRIAPAVFAPAASPQPAPAPVVTPPAPAVIASAPAVAAPAIAPAPTPSESPVETRVTPPAAEAPRPEATPATAVVAGAKKAGSSGRPSALEEVGTLELTVAPVGEVFIDGKSIGMVSRGKPLSVPGLQPGEHTIKGVKLGYEPDGPRQEVVYPGQESTVSIKITIARRRNKAAEDLLDNGLKYYQKGYEQNYKKAADVFQKAFAADPANSKAAYYLARTYNALFDEDKAQEYFKKAIEIDPDYMEARAN